MLFMCLKNKKKYPGQTNFSGQQIEIFSTFPRKKYFRMSSAEILTQHAEH